MEALSLSLGGIIVDLIILFIITSSTYLGYRKGLVGVIFKLCVFIVSILIVLALYKPVSNAIITNTQIDEKIASAIQNSLSNTSLANNEALTTSNTNLSEGIVNLINSLLSDALAKAQDSNALVYISTELAYAFIRFGSMVIIFVVAKFALLLVRFIADILASLPIISTFNKSGGLIYGILKGMITVYIILAIFSLISPIINSWGIIGYISDSLIGSKMYNHNIIINLISKH